MAGRTEGSPRDVEPVGAGQELVGQLVMAQELHQLLELRGILGADVCSLALHVLRVTDASHEAVDARVAETAVDQDGTADGLAGGLQELTTAVGHVGNLLDGWDVVGILLQVTELQ